MIPRGPLPAVADPRHTMPSHAGARHAAIEAAMRALDDESRRFERLGFERPLDRCREARRFWRFVRALHALAVTPAPGRPAPGRGASA